jgi:hypothetical protein
MKNSRLTRVIIVVILICFSGRIIAQTTMRPFTTRLAKKLYPKAVHIFSTRFADTTTRKIFLCEQLIEQDSLTGEPVLFYRFRTNSFTYIFNREVYLSSKGEELKSRYKNTTNAYEEVAMHYLASHLKMSDSLKKSIENFYQKYKGVPHTQRANSTPTMIISNDTISVYSPPNSIDNFYQVSITSDSCFSIHHFEFGAVIKNNKFIYDIAVDDHKNLVSITELSNTHKANALRQEKAKHYEKYGHLDPGLVQRYENAQDTDSIVVVIQCIIPSLPRPIIDKIDSYEDIDKKNAERNKNASKLEDDAVTPILRMLHTMGYPNQVHYLGFISGLKLAKKDLQLLTKDPRILWIGAESGKAIPE